MKTSSSETNTSAFDSEKKASAFDSEKKASAVDPEKKASAFGIENIANPNPSLVACQGIPGAYSFLAAQTLFPDASNLYFRNFRAVARAVSEGMCPYGILPIENNIYGSVREVYRIIGEEQVSIVRGITVRINHRLLAREGARLSEITTIYSHEQALGQCSEFLHSLGDKVRIVPCLNTALAARMVAEAEGPDALCCAAISSPECADLYCLTVLRRNIADSDYNCTRFICIAKQPELWPDARRISIVLSVAHKPGSLASVLDYFAAAGIDLLKIESAPIPGRDFEFRFYIDIASSPLEEATMQILRNLEKQCPQYRYLGCYTEERRELLEEEAPTLL